MLYSIVFDFCVLTALLAGVLSAVSDYKGLMIPNRYSVIIITSFFVGYGALYAGGLHNNIMEPFLLHLAAAAIVFIVTFIMFALNVWGAGDSKLSLAYALWVGVSGVFGFIMVMTVFGGVLGVVALVLKKKPLWRGAPAGTWIARVQEGENVVPYGIAIVAGAFCAFFVQGYWSIW